VLPWRLLMLSAGLIAGTIVVALATAAFASSTRAAAARTAAPACPARDTSTMASTRGGSRMTLVPSGAVQLLLCRYSGLNGPPPFPATTRFGLITERLLTSTSQVENLADALNALPAPSAYAISCPVDTGERIIAYFVYRSGARNPVTVGLTGCQEVTNGHVLRNGLDAPAISQLESLVPLPPHGKLKGELRVCTNTARTDCQITTWSQCETSGACVTAQSVAVFNGAGKEVALVALHNSRFSVTVSPGRLKVELLGAGDGLSNQVMATAIIRVRAGGSGTVTFTQLS